MNHSHKNRLAQEQSPYLLQHQNNPVDWYPWGDEAFAEARRRDVPILLSIGYSTCYWCHVMEKDSFEREDVADVLNPRFVAIKVDREEMPDIDGIYMDAVMGLTGRGGWPMTVFLDHNLNPFFGGTFFWRDQFVNMLEQISGAWRQKRSELVEQGGRVLKYLEEKNVLRHSGEGRNPVTSKNLDPGLRRGDEEIIKNLLQNFDPLHGGFGSAPKFPQPALVSLALKLGHEKNDKVLLHAATKTLMMMARGGIYDQLGGGFHRYSTDERWLVPHFEKMLYDNAQLITLYCDAWQKTAEPMFADIARETADYILRDMTHAGGGFFAAEDAGPVGGEGDFYVWQAEELKNIFGADAEKFSQIFGASKAGNWEHGKNILHVPENIAWSERQKSETKNKCETLLKARNQRERPHRDEKILASWNGLMIAALARASVVLNEPRYQQAAIRAANFIREKLFAHGKLLRRFCSGDARFDATLDDYAFLIDGLLELNAATKESSWLAWAKQLQIAQDELFWVAESGAYAATPLNAKNIIVRKFDFYDGALPSGNSVALGNLQRFAGYDVAMSRDKIDLLSKTVMTQSQKSPMGVARGLVACRDGVCQLS